MSLKQQMIADSAIFFNLAEFGELVTYNGTEIVAISDIGEGIRRRQQPNTRERTGYFEVLKKDVPKPIGGDIIVDSAERKWYMTEISAEDEISFVLRCSTNRSPFKGG